MFVLKNLGILGGEAKGGASIRLYSYIIPKEDTFNDLLSDGYFNNQKGEFLENDIIMVLDVDKIKYLIVKEAGLRSIKVEQISFYKLSDLTPQISSISGSAGISENMARADHRHKKAVATESERGEIVIATEEEVNEGIDNTKAITSLKLKNKINEVNENISNNVELLNKSIEDNINILEDSKANVDLDNITDVAENRIRELIVKNGSLPLFSTLWSDHLLNDASYLRSDTFSWQNGNIYVSAYNQLVNEKNSATEIKEYKSIILPTFKSNTQDGITISDSRDNTTVLQAIFNGTNQSNQIGTWNTYWINIDYGKETLIKSYVIQADNNGSAESPTAWTLQGYNGTDWEVIDTQENITFKLNESKTFNIDTENLYTQYRIVFSAGNGNNGELKKVSFNVEYISFIYYKSTNGFNIVDPTQEQNIIDLFNNTGIAWFYILDETNKQFKLPRSKYNFVGYRNNVGGYVEESLPNITGSADVAQGASHSYNATGAFYETRNGNGGNWDTAENNKLNIDASRSSSTYQNGAPVQQRATEMYLYFYVGNVIRNETEIDVGAITEELNNKVDIGLTNISDNGKQVLKQTCIGYPDYSAGVSLVFNQENTMPTNGWLEISGMAFYGANVIISINGVQKTISTSSNNQYSCTAWVIIPVSAGDIIKGVHSYNNDGKFIFYPNK